MKNFANLFFLVAIISFSACQSEDDLMEVREDVAVNMKADVQVNTATQVLFEKTLVDGLKSPVGVEFVSELGGVVIAEAGTGNNDGQITLYRRGMTVVLADSFPSVVRPDGNVEGTTHIAINRGVLWIVNGVSGKLYRFSLWKYRSEQPPISADDLPSDDIKAFIFSQGFTDSNIYKIIFDERGNAYVTDSGANVVVKRSKEGKLSIFAKIPKIPNPTPVGAPTVEAVPTGIAYNGKNFFVSAFGGFPFAPGSSRIYEINKSGEIVGFQEGYTTLIDLEFSEPRARSLFALQFGTFGEAGFEPNSGALVLATPQGPVEVIEGLNFPNGLEVLASRSSAKAYITSIADGTLTLYVFRLNHPA